MDKPEDEEMAKTATKSRNQGVGLTLSEFVSHQIEIQQGMGKTQRDIARDLGYDKPNMISMIKTGDAKVPLDKIPALAKSLNVDARFLFRLAMAQFWPEAHQAINEVFGDVLSKNEVAIIRTIRDVTKNVDPALDGALEKKIRAAFR